MPAPTPHQLQNNRQTSSLPLPKNKQFDGGGPEPQRRSKLRSFLFGAVGTMALAGAAMIGFSGRFDEMANVARESFSNFDPVGVDPMTTATATVETQPVIVAAVPEPAMIEDRKPLEAWPVIGDIQPKPVKAAAQPVPQPLQMAEATPKPTLDPVPTAAPAAPPTAAPVPIETAALAKTAATEPVAAIAPVDTQCVAALQAQAKKLRILFSSGSTAVSEQARKQVASFAAAAGKCPAAHIEVAGHTDAAGADRSNKGLSQKRAEEVLKLLQVNGDPAGKRFTATGYGTRELLVKVKTAKSAQKPGFWDNQFGPVVSEHGVTTEQARTSADQSALNRRVELRVRQE
jgi:outer membrane protein OmpA-like peptidoglycan-associated protein